MNTAEGAPNPDGATSLRAVTTSVSTSGKLERVPNQPRTKIRGIRIPDELWQAAQEVAAERGESLSKVVRAALERYVARHRKH